MIHDGFHNRQLALWRLAAENYAGLQRAESRRFEFCGFGVTVQYNPARIVSTGAKTDAGSVAARPCFLCRANRPEEQLSVAMGQFELLVNPFPIFNPHYVIAHMKHIPQTVIPYIGDMLGFARQMPEFAIFYNGPRCGASAPDHMHFQACRAIQLPVVGDYFRLRHDRSVLLVRRAGTEVRTLNGYLRTVICIEAPAVGCGVAVMDDIIAALRSIQPEEDEPMMNIVAAYYDGCHYIWIFPRKAFRPWQYAAPGESGLLVSPAAVEMAGLVITPVAGHFKKVTAADIEDIYSQCSMTDAAEMIRQI